MNERIILAVAGALIALASDYVSYRKARIYEPDVPFDWGMAFSRLVIGIAGGFGIGEVAS